MSKLDERILNLVTEKFNKRYKGYDLKYRLLENDEVNFISGSTLTEEHVRLLQSYMQQCLDYLCNPQLLKLELPKSNLDFILNNEKEMAGAIIDLLDSYFIYCGKITIGDYLELRTSKPITNEIATAIYEITKEIDKVM